MKPWYPIPLNHSDGCMHAWPEGKWQECSSGCPLAPLGKLTNRTMARMLQDCTAVDVRTIGHETSEPGVYHLDKFLPDVAFCDPSTERWILTIARRRDTKEILASVDERFFEAGPAAWEMLYLF